jgi:hypothetical protein
MGEGTRSRLKASGFDDDKIPPYLTMILLYVQLRAIMHGMY